jgi:hypothetical protein
LASTERLSKLLGVGRRDVETNPAAELKNYGKSGTRVKT